MLLAGCADMDAPPPAATLHTIAGADGTTLIDGRIGGAAGVFLFDSGGGETLVTPDAARQAGCRPWGRITGFRMTGERLDLPRCDALRVEASGTALTAPIAGVFDINAFVDPHAMPALSGSIALDVFAGRAITIRPRAHEIVIETASSLAARIADAREVPIRLVRDAEGVALTVDAAVPTPSGNAWMELDTGNLGRIAVGRHVAAALGLDPAASGEQHAAFALAGGIPVVGPARVSDLILDGDIGEAVLGAWDLTLDLDTSRAWLRPATSQPTGS